MKRLRHEFEKLSPLVGTFPIGFENGYLKNRMSYQIKNYFSFWTEVRIKNTLRFNSPAAVVERTLAEYLKG